MQLQEAERRQESARVHRSSVWGMSWMTALEDVREAVTGIFGDMYGSGTRKSVQDIMMHGDRLRGLGIVLIIIALTGCAIQGVLSD